MNALPQAIANGRNQNGHHRREVERHDRGADADRLAHRLGVDVARRRPRGSRPCIVVGIAQAASTISIMRATSARASPIVLPISVVTERARSSRRASSASRSANSRRRARSPRPRARRAAPRARPSRRRRDRRPRERHASEHLAGRRVGDVGGPRPRRGRPGAADVVVQQADVRGFRVAMRSPRTLHLAEQVLLASAPQHRRARPVVVASRSAPGRAPARPGGASPWRGPGRRPRPRRPRSRSPSRAARVRRRPAARSNPPAPPGRRRPCATSVWPRRHGRPNESETTTAGRTPRAASMPARSRRADSSGSSGSRISSPGREALDWSTPAFAHTNPWRVSQISTPSRARSSSADSSSTTCTRRASLPCSPAARRARSPGSIDSSRAPAPRPSTRPCARPRARRRRPGRAARRPRAAPRGRRRAARRAGARARGGARSRRAPGPPRAHGASGRAGAARRESRRVAAAGVERRRQRVQVLAGVDVQRERRHGSTAQDRRRRARRPRAARSCRARSAGSIASGGVAAARWSPRRGGPARHDRGGPVEPRRSRPATSPGSSSGVSPGTSRTRSKPCASACRMPISAAADWPASLGVAQHLAPARRAPRPRPSGRRSRPHRVDSGHPPQRRQHVREHRLRERLPRPAPSAMRQALLRRAETLHGEDRDRAHRGP